MTIICDYMEHMNKIRKHSKILIHLLMPKIIKRVERMCLMTFNDILFIAKKKQKTSVRTTSDNLRFYS